jgi:hypothetical protein
MRFKDFDEFIEREIRIVHFCSIRHVVNMFIRTNYIAPTVTGTYFTSDIAPIPAHDDIALAYDERNSSLFISHYFNALSYSRHVNGAYVGNSGF